MNIWKTSKIDINDMNDRELAIHAGISPQHFLYLKRLAEGNKISKRGIKEMTNYITDYLNNTTGFNTNNNNTNTNRKSTDSLINTFGRRKSRKRKSRKRTLKRKSRKSKR
jgi:hypothetical protein